MQQKAAILTNLSIKERTGIKSIEPLPANLPEAVVDLSKGETRVKLAETLGIPLKKLDRVMSELPLPA